MIGIQNFRTVNIVEEESLGLSGDGVGPPEVPTTKNKAIFTSRQRLSAKSHSAKSMACVAPSGNYVFADVKGVF